MNKIKNLLAIVFITIPFELVLYKMILSFLAPADVTSTVYATDFILDHSFSTLALLLVGVTARMMIVRRTCLFK